MELQSLSDADLLKLRDTWTSDPAVQQQAREGGPLRVTVRPSDAKPITEWSNEELLAARDRQMGRGEDALKSAGAGLVRGTAGLIGLPETVASLGASGIEAATDFIGKQLGIETQRPQGKPLVELPSSEKMLREYEAEAGPLHEPQYKTGKFARNAAEFIPGALAGPAGSARQIGTNLLRFGVGPGLTSEAAGQVAHEYAPAAEPYVRGGTAVATGVGASMLSRPATAGRAIQGQLPEYVTPAHVQRAEALVGAAQQRGITLTWPEALSQVTGRPVLTDMQRIVESSAAGRPQMQAVMGDRPQQINTAAHREIDRLAPARADPSSIGSEVGRTAESAINDARGVISAHTEPFYRASENIRLTPAEMGQMRRVTPGYERARDAIRADEQLNRHVAHLPDNSVGFLNEVKKYLGEAAENARSPVQQGRSVQRSAGLSTDEATVRQAAIDAAARAVGPGRANPYEVALNTQRDARERYLQPLLDGPLGKLADRDISTKRAIEALFPANPDGGSHNEVTRAVSALVARRPAAAQSLIRAHAEAELDAAFNAAGRGQEAAQYAGAGFAHRMVGSSVVPTQRLENLRAAIEALPNGRQTWDGFAHFLEIAQATGTRQSIGSKTTFNTADMKALEAGGPVAAAVKTGLSPGKWWSIVNDKWSAWQLGNNLEQLAHILTDPRSGPLLRRLADLPRGSEQAGAAAARIILQSNQSLGVPAPGKN